MEVEWMQVHIPDKILLSVQKPARYIGGEVNMVRKDLKDIDVRFAFCFPDVYDVGMSHLGMQVLYHDNNRYDYVYWERCFAPWTDMEEQMRKHDIPLYSLETMTPLNEFDFVGFTLQYEMSFTNVLNMLDLAKVPLLSTERGEGSPIVVGGGPCVCNPEPIADFFDLFVLGEGEEVNLELCHLYLACKEAGDTREEFLRKAAQIEGVYVPKFYEVEYNEDGSKLVREFGENTEVAVETLYNADGSEAYVYTYAYEINDLDGQTVTVTDQNGEIVSQTIYNADGEVVE